MQYLDSLQNPFFLHALIALFGAFAHALDSNRKGQTKSFTDFIALTIMSSFSGAIFALVGLHFLPDQSYLTTAIAGTGGYLGIEGMSYIVYFMRNKFLTK